MLNCITIPRMRRPCLTEGQPLTEYSDTFTHFRHKPFAAFEKKTTPVFYSEMVITAWLAGVWRLTVLVQAASKACGSLTNLASAYSLIGRFHCGVTGLSPSIWPPQMPASRVVTPPLVGKRKNSAPFYVQCPKYCKITTKEKLTLRHSSAQAQYPFESLSFKSTRGHLPDSWKKLTFQMHSQFSKKPEELRNATSRANAATENMPEISIAAINPLHRSD